MTPPLESHLETLSRSVHALLSVSEDQSLIPADPELAAQLNAVHAEVKDRLLTRKDNDEQAIQRMVEDAQRMGADAVINVRLTTSTVMQGASEILAYGTAVKLK